jgi:MraZ protein
MFLGEYQHSLDAKGRVILPSRFRDALAGGAVIAKGVDGCLAVYTNEEFERVATDIREKSKQSDRQRQASRSLFAGASDFTPDKQGRVAIPTVLREYAHLERDVVVTGAFSRIEIWDSTRWAQTNQIGAEALANDTSIGDFGL